MTAVLPDFRDIDVTDPVVRAALVKGGAFLHEEGLTHLFAFSVGHCHFGRGETEGLVEVTDPEAGLFTTKLVSLSSLSANQEVAWRVIDGDLVAMVWAQPSQVDAMSPDFRAALTKVSAFLVREGLTHLLTIRLLPTNLQVGKGQVLREYTNKVDRSQMTILAWYSAGNDDVAATWWFPNGIPTVLVECHSVTCRG